MVDPTDFNLTEMYGDFLQHVVDEIEASDEILHFGVKGMRWGVRKSEPSGGKPELKSLGPDRIEVTTKFGEKVDLVKNPTTGFHRGLARISKKYREEYAKTATLSIRTKNGKKVGEANVWKKDDGELYLNWLGIDRSQRGKGYATATLKAAEKFGRQQGMKRMTLEVPGNSPDARHIYTKLGFKVVKEAEGTNDIWGGLTEMQYDFKHSSEVDPSSALEHFGVKGMRWGVRKADPAKTRAKAQQKWDKKAKSARGWTDDYRKASKRMNRGELAKINNKKDYKGKNLRIDGPNQALVKKYDIEVGNRLAALMQIEAGKRVGSRPGTRQRVNYTYSYRDGDVLFKLSEARHDAFADYFFLAKKNSAGLITEIQVVNDAGDILEQSDDVEDFFEHFGVKGMKWGQRKADRPAPSADSTNFRGIRTKGKAGGVQSLSNKELADFIARANLERQYKTLNPSAIKRGGAVIKSVLGLGRTANEVVGFVNSPAGKQLQDTLRR